MTLVFQVFFSQLICFEQNALLDNIGVCFFLGGHKLAIVFEHSLGDKRIYTHFLKYIHNSLMFGKTKIGIFPKGIQPWFESAPGANCKKNTAK